MTIIFNIMERIIDRVNDYIQYKGMSIRAFESEAGINYSTISAAIKRGKELNTATLLKIIDTYDDIDTDWLMKGEGDMIKSEDSESKDLSDSPSNSLPDNLLDISDPLEISEELSQRKIHTLDEDFTYTDNDNAGKVPIITEQGFAFFDRDNPDSIKAEDYYYIKEFRNADFMLRITGDTMQPKHKSGDLLACRHIDMQTFWQYGKVHAVLTCNQGLIIRRVMPGDNYKVLLLTADNPAYPDCRILIDEIITAAIVIGSISMD